mgnify:FL=1
MLPIPMDMLLPSHKENKTMIYLRPYDSVEVNRLLSWIDSNELLNRFAGPGFDFPLSKSQWDQHLLDASIFPYFVVDIDSDETIGYAELVSMSNNEVKFCRLIIGDTDFRGIGLGKLLVRELIYEALSRFNPSKITLNVYQDNIAALKCYLSEGFKVNESVSRSSLVNGVEWKSYQMDFIPS